jgi:hypothetical protein
VQGVRPVREFVRYSDRYLDVPQGPFDKVRDRPCLPCRTHATLAHALMPTWPTSLCSQSELLTMTRNVHFPDELLPRKGEKRASGSGNGAQKRQRRGGAVSSRLDEIARQESNPSAAPGSTRRVVESDEEEDGAAEGAREGDETKEGAVPDTDEESVESEEELYNEDDYRFGDDDGDDYDDDGGDDDGEPTY